MKLSLPFWPHIHKLLVVNQGIIKNILLAVSFLGLFLLPLGFYLYTNNFSLYLEFYKLSGTLGKIALYLFLLTLIPGIFQRFKIFLLESASVVLFRRQIGILTYVLALIHSFYISTIPAIVTNKFGPAFMLQHEVYGTIAILILFPVWITSNDISQNTLGRFWKTLQRLTYIALIVIFLHVSLTETSAAVLAGCVITLEIISWIKVWLNRKVVNA